MYHTPSAEETRRQIHALKAQLGASHGVDAGSGTEGLGSVGHFQSLKFQEYIYTYELYCS